MSKSRKINLLAGGFPPPLKNIEVDVHPATGEVYLVLDGGRACVNVMKLLEYLNNQSGGLLIEPLNWK